MIPADKKVERMLTVARMYYEQGKTQNEIASAIGVSRPLVSVLLTEARECGIVTITVNDIRVTAELLTERLRARFGVERVVIIPDEDIDDNTNKALAARAYAEIFSSENENARLGIGWGSMLDKMASYAESLADVKKGDGRIFPLVGGINSVIRSYHTNELVRILALKSGKRPAFLYIPALLDTNADLELTKRTEPYALIEKEWRAMEQAVVSLSNFPSYPDLGVKSFYGDRLTERHAVGRILAYYFDVNGRIIRPQEETALQIPIDILRRAQVTALCSGQVKPEAVAGALRLGIINTVMLPFGLAARVADMQ